jgi:aryl sulfotransferase
VLANLCHESDTPVSINALDAMPVASGRAAFDAEMGIESSDLTPEEIDACRPEVYRRMAARSASPLLLKVHDAYGYLSDGHPLLPPDATLGAVYVVRNPLDVAVSGAAFARRTIDVVCEGLGTDARLCESRGSLSMQLHQRLGSWSGHVRSWLDAAAGFPLHVVRYEDMHADPLAAFTSVARALGLPADEARLHRAIVASRFERLQAQEKEEGFKERPASCDIFFREGRVGAWREHLRGEHVARIVADHGDVMRHLGYLTPAGDPAF